MKIQQPTDNTLYITIGGYVYYFDDSIEGEYLVERWKNEDGKPETLQISDFFDSERINGSLVIKQPTNK